MITDAEFAKSYKELYVLLHYVPKRYLEKLPVRVIKFFEDNMDRDYDYQVDPNLSYTDKIITLSTCDDIGTKRVVVHAKLINIENK